MSKLKIGIVAAIVIASIMLSVAIQYRTRVRLREQNEAIGQGAEELTQLSRENKRLANLIARVNSSQALSKEQLAELLRLRSEVGQLRGIGKGKVQLQETNAQLRAAETKAEKQLAEAQAASNYWPKDQLSYVGYSDPESSLKSMLAAMVSGNVNAWRECCTPEAIARMEKEWENHGLSKAQEEEEIRAMSGALVSLSAGFHILEQKMTTPDEAIINLSFDGEGVARKFVLRKIGNQWKFQDLIVAGQEEPAQ